MNNKKHGNPHKLTKEQDQEIAKLHLGGMKVQDLANLFGVYPSTIRLALKYEGITPNPFRLHIRQDAFDNLNNELSSYWLGFIYADGYVSVGDSPKFSVKLKHGDKNHLEKLRIFLEIDGPLREIKTKSREKFHDQIYIQSSNREFCMKLDKLGIVVNRTNPEITLRKIPDNFMHHFFRGIFDGDGCAQRIPGFTFLSQREILEKLREELICKAGASEIRKVKQTGKICRIDYGGFQQALKIKQYLYKNASVFLERKLEVINSWTQQTGTELKRKYYHK